MIFMGGYKMVAAGVYWVLMTAHAQRGREGEKLSFVD